MRFLLTAVFLLTATQAFAEIRHGVCTVTSYMKLNFHSSNWFPPEVVPKGTRMTIQYDEDTVVLTRGDTREEFTVFYKDAFDLKSVNAQPNKTTILNIGDSNCALSRGVQYYKGEHRDIRIYTVGDFPTQTNASCPCANLD
jgi:hypothetical protein